MDVSKLVISSTSPAKTCSEHSPCHRMPNPTTPNDGSQDRLADSFKIGERLKSPQYDKFDDLEDKEEENKEGHVDVGRSCSRSHSIGNADRLKHGHTSDGNTTDSEFILPKFLRRNPTRAAKQHSHACINTIKRATSPLIIDKLRPSPTPFNSGWPKESVRTSGPTHSTLLSPRPELLLDYGTLWRRFHHLGNEMIITKSGRCLFPSLKVSAQNLDPQGTYSIMLDFVQLSPYRYRWRRGQWVCIGEDRRRFGMHQHRPGGAVKPARLDETEECRDGTINVLRSDTYTHPDSPQNGSFWMSMGASFHKGKLTNRQLPFQPPKTQNGPPSKSRPQPNHSSLPPGYFVLNSFHRYQPRVHLVKHHLDEEDVVTTFRFAETEFVAVTHYQNERVNKLKKENNPHAKGFKDTEERRGMEIESQNTKGETDDEMEERAEEEAKQMEAKEYTDSENDESTDNSADTERVEARRNFFLINHSALPTLKRTFSWFQLQREREAAYDADTSTQQNEPVSPFEKHEAQYITPKNVTPSRPCTPPVSYSATTTTPFAFPIEYDAEPTNPYKPAHYPIENDADLTISYKPTHHPIFKSTSYNHSTSPFHFSVKSKVDHLAHGTLHNIPPQNSYTAPVSQATPSTLPIPPINNPYFPPILPSPTLSQDSFPWHYSSPNMTSLPTRTPDPLDLPSSTLASHYPLRPRLKHNYSEPAPPLMNGFSLTPYEAPVSDCRNSNTLPEHEHPALADGGPGIWTQQYQLHLPENQLATAAKKARNFDGKMLSFNIDAPRTAWAPGSAPYTPTGGLTPAFQALSVDGTAENTGRLEAENARLREFIRAKFGHEVERQIGSGEMF